MEKRKIAIFLIGPVTLDLTELGLSASYKKKQCKKVQTF